MRILVAIAGIPGEATLAGFEMQIEADSFNMEAKVPFDPVTGQRSGRLQLGDAVITKSLDKASMLLGAALVNRTNLGKVTVSFIYETKTTENPLTIDLNNTTVRLIQDAATAGGAIGVVEQIAFSYQSATFTYAGKLASTLTP